jgi:hypothetical protein
MPGHLGYWGAVATSATARPVLACGQATRLDMLGAFAEFETNLHPYASLRG